MRRSLLALVAALVLVAGGVVAAVALIDGEDEQTGGDVAGAVRAQLPYLDPASSLVAAVDMRFEGTNWRHLRGLASRVLREYRSEAEPEERAQIPPNVTGGLELLARFAGLSFEEDVKPLLDGYLVVGVTFPPRRPLSRRLEQLGEVVGEAAYDPRRGAYVEVAPDEPFPRPGRAPLVREADGTRVTEEEGRAWFDALQRRDEAARPRFVVAYRTNAGGLRRVVEKLLEEERPQELSGYEDTLLLESSIALVGDDTIVFAEGGPEQQTGGAERPSRALRDALDRGRAGGGYPRARLTAAQRELAVADPLVLAAGDPTLARAASDVGLTNDLFDETDLERARREVPWLDAVRGLAASLDLDERRATGLLRIASDGRRLGDGDLPLARPTRLELPDTRGVGSATGDQSVTTTFAARVARALFSESDFVRAVERAERELDIRFEDEVLRQFNCPSISVFDGRRSQFAARSCLRDPRRMRALLPRLRPHLPRVVTALQNLGDRGMLGLLLVAPDAPATPSLPLAQIEVAPLGPGSDGDHSELLYEMTGLHDNVRSELAQAGPERVVFGMIGDQFVVASDRELARRIATLPTRPQREPAATAIRVPGRGLLSDAGGIEARIAARIVDELIAGASANRNALSARAELIFGP